jgi:ABC-type transporter MlaC component
MKKLSALLLLFVFFVSMGEAAEKVDLLSQAQDFVKELLELGKISKDSQSLESNPQAKKLVEKLSSSVDFEALARASLGTRWTSLKPDLRSEFMATLRETIETILYPRAHRITTPLSEIQFSRNTKKAQNVIARTKFESEKEGEIIQKDLELELIFSKNGKKIVDAVLEGELVSANLKRQFDQALQKKSMEQLLAQMKTRLKKAQSPKADVKTDVKKESAL